MYGEFTQNYRRECLGIVPNGIKVIWLINIADRLKTLKGSFSRGDKKVKM